MKLNDEGLSKIQKLQQRVEELIVQLDLGKYEAIDAVEQQKERLKSTLNQCKQSVHSHDLQQQLDELQLQLQLGKMETKQAYLEQRGKIEDGVQVARDALHHAKYKSVEEFDDAAHSLSDKVHMLALNLGAAGLIAKEQAEEAREKVRTSLQRLAGSLQADAEWTAEKARQAGDDAQVAMKDILDNLRSLIR